MTTLSLREPASLVLVTNHSPSQLISPLHIVSFHFTFNALVQTLLIFCHAYFNILLTCLLASILACMLSRFNSVQFSVPPWIVALQGPLSTGFSRQEYWSCHFLLQGIFPTQGLNLRLLCPLAWQAGSLTLAAPEKPLSIRALL